MIPNYLLVVDLGLIDSRWALLLTSAFNTFNMIILKNSFLSVPDSLEESARLDGANDLHIMWHIVIPLSKASIAVITLFVAVALWNSWFTASIYITDRNKWPIQMFLREILINNSQKSLESGAQASAMGVADPGQVHNYYYCNGADSVHLSLCAKVFCQGCSDRLCKGVTPCRKHPKASGMPTTYSLFL